jgi:hypothetical protein
MPICLIEKAAASLCSSAVEVIELEPHANREVPSACILAVLTTPIQMLSYPQELKEDPAITMSLNARQSRWDQRSIHDTDQCGSFTAQN